jgi:multidrug efflux pump subunit AcrA (membrane-fusion protein)
MNAKSLIVTIGIVAVVILSTFRLGNQSPSESSTTAVSDKLILVDVASVTAGSITESIQAVGTLEAIASITVRPEIAGVIRRIHFRDGQVVERAVPLVELDQEELQSQVTQASAEEKMAVVIYETESVRSMAVIVAQPTTNQRLVAAQASASEVCH